jgi:hypothetical protein
MIVLVMSIGVMRMGMGMRLMSVAMGVLHSRFDRFLMTVLMVLVMDVLVFVLQQERCAERSSNAGLAQST